VNARTIDLGMTYESEAFDREGNYSVDKVAAHPSILNGITYKNQLPRFTKYWIFSPEIEK